MERALLRLGLGARVVLAVVRPFIHLLAAGQDADGMRAVGRWLHAQLAALLDAVHRGWVGNAYMVV